MKEIEKREISKDIRLEKTKSFKIPKRKGKKKKKMKFTHLWSTSGVLLEFELNLVGGREVCEFL